MPSISAIVPTCNRPEMAAEALKSIVEQTRPPDQIVLVDDGHDHSGRKLADQFNVELIETRGRGPAMARNRGVTLAIGEWLAFCDDDDIWLPQRLEKQETRIGEKVDLIYADALDDEGERLLTGREAREGQVFGSLLLDNWVTTSTVLLRRRAFVKAHGFEERFCPAEDYRLWLRIGRFGNFAFVNEPLAAYRAHPGQLQTDIARMFGATADVVEDALSEAGWAAQQIPNLARRLRQLRFVQARMLISQGENAQARQVYRQAWRHQRAYLQAPLFYLLSFFGI